MGSHIPDVDNDEVPDSDVELEEEASDIVPTIDASFVDDINSELQDQGIGGTGDAFSTQVTIISHCLRNGKLDLKAKLSVSLEPISVDWESLRQDVPATNA
jgi:hypothetical protein